MSAISVTVIYHTMCLTVSEADPGFQARGGCTYKNCAERKLLGYFV